MAASYSERYFSAPGCQTRALGGLGLPVWLAGSCGQRHALDLEFNFALLTLIKIIPLINILLVRSLCIQVFIYIAIL